MRRIRAAVFHAPRGRIPAAGVAAGFYALVVIALLWPALSGQAVFSAAANLYDWVPWAALRPAAANHYQNPLLGDHTRSFYPWLLWARLHIRAGDLPQWNPLVLSGTPFYANAQVQLLSPFSLPLWVLPFKYGLGVSAALKLWVAALGAYLLGRQLGLRFGAALVSGLAFGFSPFMIVWLSHTVAPVVAMLPWGVLFAERIAARGRGADALGLAAVSVVLAVGGHPESQAHVTGAVALYTVVRLLVTRSLEWRTRALRLGLLAAGITLGVVVAAAFLVPVAMSLPGGAGVVSRSAEAPKTLSDLRTLVFPDWWGRPSGVAVAGAGGSNYNTRDFYAGAVALALAVIGVLDVRAWRRTLPVAVLAFVGFAIPLGVQPFAWLLAHVPPFNHALNTRLIMLDDFGVAMLAGFGVEHLLSARAASRRAFGVAAAALAAGVIALRAARPTAHTWRLLGHHLATGATRAIPREIELISIAWWLALVVGFVIVLALRGRLPALLVPGCLALMLVDIGHTAWHYQPMPPSNLVFADTPPAIRFLQHHQGSERMTAVEPAMPADTELVWGLRDVRGLDPPQPRVAYADLLRLQMTPAPLVSRTGVEKLTPVRTRVLDLLSVRYVLTSPLLKLSGLPGFRYAYRGADASVYENTRALPRASVPARVIVRRSDSAARAEIGSPGFDPASDVITGSAVPAGSGDVRLTHDGDERVVIAASMRRAGLVVLSDAWSSGWTVTVDGHPAKPVRVDTVIRGVVVPRGRHVVTWSYRTPGLVLGSALSGAGVAITAVWAGVLSLGRRRRRTGPADDAPAL
jgi:hypothetical protein